jgi:hypothetical protein
MNNKEVLFRNLINHAVFELYNRLQDLHENFRILFADTGHQNISCLFDIQIQLLQANADKLCYLSGQLNPNDIVDNLTDTEGQLSTNPPSQNLSTEKI